MRLPKLHAATPFLIAVSLVMGLAGVALAVSASVTLNRDAAATAVRDMSHQYDSLARQIEAGLAVFDLALREAGAARGNPLITPIGHDLIRQYTGFIDILDPAGDVVASSRPLAPKPPNFASRDYFRDQSRGPPGHLVIGRPFATGPNQNAAIPISRRLETQDGRFAGVAVAGIRLTWLRDVLARSAAGAHASASIRLEDGSILMRAPFDRDDIGRLGGDDPAWRAWRETGAEPIGGLRLLRQLAGAPLVLDLALSPVQTTAAWDFAPPLLPCLGLLVLSGLAWRLRTRGDRIAAGAWAANDDRMRVLATMSHELRTPLTAILGQAALLSDEGGLTRHQAGRLARLNDAGAAMRAVVERVTDIARPGDQGVPPAVMCRDLDQLLRGCHAMVEEMARSRDLRLTVQIDPAAPRFARVNHDMVTQVLVNLLSNAIKFTGEGEIILRLRHEAGALIFEVADTGPGIARVKRHRLFGAYDRLGLGWSGIEGTGLGLSITADLVHRMGGQLGHRDNLGGGSVFWVTIPFAAPDDAMTGALMPGSWMSDSGEGDSGEPHLGKPGPDLPGPGMSEPSAAPVPRPATRRMVLLLADDIDATRAVTADILRNAGHTVIEVNDGEAAIREAGARDFDAIVTDMRMPKYNGVEASRRIRALSGRRGEIPIILLTADAFARPPETSRTDGIDFHVPKPFKAHELLDAIDAASRLTPNEDSPNFPVLDHAILDQLTHSLGLDAMALHLNALDHRIEDLLSRLDEAPSHPATRDAVHDLVGITGLMGMNALSVAARRFDRGHDTAAGLSQSAAETLRALRLERAVV